MNPQPRPHRVSTYRLRMTRLADPKHIEVRGQPERALWDTPRHRPTKCLKELSLSPIVILTATISTVTTEGHPECLPYNGSGLHTRLLLLHQAIPLRFFLLQNKFLEFEGSQLLAIVFSPRALHIMRLNKLLNGPEAGFLQSGLPLGCLNKQLWGM